MSEYTEYVYRRTREPWGWSAENTGEEIVRCRDCRCCNKVEVREWCVRHNIATSPDAFCAWGERRVEQ